MSLPWDKKSWETMSVRERILEDLDLGTGRVRTAMQISKYVQRKPSTVSSQLKKMVDEGLVLRVKGFGPRGGYGYLQNPNKRDECLWILGKLPRGVRVHIGPVAQRYLDHAGVKFDE